MPSEPKCFAQLEHLTDDTHSPESRVCWKERELVVVVNNTKNSVVCPEYYFTVDKDQNGRPGFMFMNQMERLIPNSRIRQLTRLAQRGLGLGHTKQGS